MILEEFNLTLIFYSHFVDILRSDGQCHLIVTVMGAFRHNSALVHFHPDPDTFLGVGVYVRYFRDDGGCRDDGGLWGWWHLWQVFLPQLVNVCMQVRTWIGWFVFRYLCSA